MCVGSNVKAYPILQHFIEVISQPIEAVIATFIFAATNERIVGEWNHKSTRIRSSNDFLFESLER